MDYKFAQAGDTKIFYHERGSGEPLVLIMGFGAEGTVWGKHLAVYEKHFRCIILDNRGVGRSDQPQGPYTTRMMAGDTIAVMDHAGVERAQVAGISMGGTIAQELAINYPARVSALALISTWARFNNYAKSVYENLKAIRAAVRPKDFTALLQLWIFAPPYYEHHRQELSDDAAAEDENGHLQSRNGFEGQLDACIQHDSVERLKQIRVPTLITVGGMDIFTPPEFSHVLHDHIHGSQLSTYPAGGHVHHWEALEQFNRETLQFFLNNQ